MWIALDYDKLLLDDYNGDGYAASDAVPFYENILTRLHRSAFIDWAYQVAEMMKKGDKLIIRQEEWKFDEWGDVAIYVKNASKEQKLWYLEPFLSKKIKEEKYTAEVFEPFDMKDSTFRNYGLRILLRLK